MHLHFYKYQGAGNDFIMIDNREGAIQLSENQVARLCERRFGIGADGLILLNKSEDADFRMVYYNADGKEGSMCGNGGRCITVFAKDLGIIEEHTHFIAYDGLHEANIEQPEWVELKMQDVHKMEISGQNIILDTGSPHYVKFCNHINQLNVFEEGRNIRYNNRFKDAGINVNFAERTASELNIRTYERGVEEETWACGTGVTAVALASVNEEKMGDYSIAVKAKGGNMIVKFQKLSDKDYENIWLCGPAKFVFKGDIDAPDC